MKKIIIIVLVVLIVGGAAVYWFLLKPPAAPETSYYVPGDFFVTNVKDSTRLLKTTIVIELLIQKSEETAIKEFLTENNHVIRDTIVFTLREKSEEELRAIQVDESLRQEIVKRLSERMGLDYIQTIYFNDYVLQ